jgi:hypothetical protein
MDRKQAAVVQKDEDGLIAFGVGARGGDRIPLARARDPGDARFDPAKRARVAEIAAQVTRGSMSP